jgi:drug/metabolite transporter (DMT)-like permease
VVFWAANFIIVKAANEQIPPLTFAFLRFSLASAVLLVALRLREGRIGLERAELLPMLGIGAIGFGIYQVMWATGLQSIPAGDSALLIAATPVVTVFIAVFVGSDRMTAAKVVGGLVSFAGVAIVVAAGPGLALGSSIAGDLLTLGAAIAWAVYVSLGAPILRHHSPLRTTAWAMVGGSLILAIPGVLQAGSTDWSAVGGGAWAGLLYSALIPAGISNVVVFHAIRLLGPTRITAFQFLVPFIAVLMGAVFLHEGIRGEQILGGLVIVAGVAITRAAAGASIVARLMARFTE